MVVRVRMSGLPILADQDGELAREDRIE